MRSPFMRRLVPPLAVGLLVATSGVGCSSAEEGSESDHLVGLAWAVLSGVNDLHNQLVAGTTEGPQDSTGPCPFGGQARVTGQTSVDESSGLEQVDLTFELTGCRIAPVSASGDMHADLTLDGVLTEKGSFSASSVNETYSADALRMVGKVTQGETWVDYDRSCDVRINRKTSSVNALVCGENVAW